MLLIYKSFRKSLATPTSKPKSGDTGILLADLWRLANTPAKTLEQAEQKQRLIKETLWLLNNSRIKKKRVAPTAMSTKPLCTVVLSDDLLTVLEGGLSRAIIDRLQRPDVVAPELMEDQDEDLYDFSVRERAIFRYQRAERFTLDKLLDIELLLSEGDGNFVGTLDELDLLSSWAEHELDFLTLTSIPFRRFRDIEGNLIYPPTIDKWLSELIVAIDMVDDVAKPMRFSIRKVPGFGWIFGRKKDKGLQVED
ncbi:hypothetical protein GO755_22670 [Spirosoma sp. HMF4905]|uniref:Uncharacterized protein n=1 Tax=Spirosoma arboris TaxID=2682092 RepID=A0A7K1SGE7_9BACT|nr:hypothetical protein [Spirosoma arboris]MVM32861.1 hypothetical protein [Spirosoma arboris]